MSGVETARLGSEAAIVGVEISVLQREGDDSALDIVCITSGYAVSGAGSLAVGFGVEVVKTGVFGTWLETGCFGVKDFVASGLGTCCFESEA